MPSISSSWKPKFPVTLELLCSRLRCLNAVALETGMPLQSLQAQWTCSDWESSQIQIQISQVVSTQNAIICQISSFPWLPLKLKEGFPCLSNDAWGTFRIMHITFPCYTRSWALIRHILKLSRRWKFQRRCKLPKTWLNATNDKRPKNRGGEISHSRELIYY